MALESRDISQKLRQFKCLVFKFWKMKLVKNTKFAKLSSPKYFFCIYSRVPNKQTGRSFIGKWQKIPPIRLSIQFSAKSPTYTFIPTFTFINFCTFLWPILTSDDLRSHFEATIGNLNQQLINCKRIFYWNFKQTPIPYRILPKNPTYTFIQTYLYIY